MLLAADIGGTNCRLASFDVADGNLVMRKQAWAPTVSIPHTEALLQAFANELGQEPQNADALVAAVAGPVRGSVAGKLTNGELCLDFRPYGPSFFLINDFIAQAYAVLTPIAGQHLAGPPATDGLRAVIGAGTGLGYATLITMPNGLWQALPSENGHAAFPFLDEENSFHSFLKRRLGIAYGTGDDVLSGRGLACLHHYLAGEKLTPAEVGQSALQHETETLVWYSRFYARACRNWMLASLSSGGLWIAGGIAAQNPLCVKNPHFLAELCNYARFENMLREMPVYLMEDAASGLWGAAEFGRQSCLRKTDRTGA